MGVFPQAILVYPQESVSYPQLIPTMDQLFFVRIVLGFLLAAAVAFLANNLGALNRSGSWAAFLTGGFVFGLGGVDWAALLLTFFISSSLLSRLFTRSKRLLSEKFSKGSRRDWAQVLANGGLGAVLAILHAVSPQSGWLFAAFLGGMSAVNADTWATEVGVLSPEKPRLFGSWEVVEPGTSGGVTTLGTLAGLGGAALVGLVAAIFHPPMWHILLLGALLGGALGSLFDSWLGASVQAIFYCPRCGKETERNPYHTCGTPTTHVRGRRWLNNDVVNFAASLVGMLTSVFVWFLWIG